VSETRAPNSTREKRSRPWLSVPSRKTLPGLETVNRCREQAKQLVGFGGGEEAHRVGLLGRLCVEAPERLWVDRALVSIDKRTQVQAAFSVHKAGPMWTCAGILLVRGADPVRREEIGKGRDKVHEDQKDCADHGRPAPPKVEPHQLPDRKEGDLLVGSRSWRFCLGRRHGARRSIQAMSLGHGSTPLLARARLATS